MICKQCKTELPDDILICPTCQRRVAVLAQQEKVDIIKEKQRKIIEDIFHSPLFLAYSIVMTVIFVLHLSNVITNLSSLRDISLANIIPLLIYGAILAAPLIPMISCWKLYANKKAFQITEIDKLKKYPSFYKTIFTILKTLAIIAFILLLIAIIAIIVIGIKASNAIQDVASDAGNLGFSGASDVAETASCALGGVGIGLVLLVTLAVVFVFFCLDFFIKSYESIGSYYDRLARSYRDGEFKFTATMPTNRLCVLAAIFFLFGFSAFAPHAGGVAPIALANSAYTILTIFFFNHSENLQKANLLELETETKKLSELTDKTNREFQEIRRIERLKEHEEQQKLELEMKKQILREQQLNQQDLIKEMMAQLAASQMQTQNQFSAATETPKNVEDNTPKED